MKILSFELSMPGRGSWNGRWSGEDKFYAVVEKFGTLKSEAIASVILSKQPYFYRWNDGWSARIDVREVDKGQALRIKKRSCGFAGYEWMVVSIIEHGVIY